MSKPTEKELIEAAMATAKTACDKLVNSYVEGVRKYASQYEEIPDFDDFMAYVEGYEWE